MVSFLLEKNIRPKTIGLHIYPENGLVGDDLNKHAVEPLATPPGSSQCLFFLEKQHPSSCRENSLGISWSLTPLTLSLSIYIYYSNNNNTHNNNRNTTTNNNKNTTTNNNLNTNKNNDNDTMYIYIYMLNIK